MKIQIDLPEELADNLAACLEFHDMSVREYIILAISEAVVKDLKKIYVIEDTGDDE